MNGQIASLNKSLDSVKSFRKNIDGSIGKTARACKQLVASHRSLADSTKRDLQDMKNTMSSLMSTALMSKLRAVSEEVQTMTVRYKKELAERKRLHNLVQELKGNIRVYLRCRPPTSKEIEQLGADAVSVSFPNPGEIKVFNEKNREKVWDFDEVFGLESTQEDVYRDVADLVVSVLDGYNVCIFACKYLVL